MENPELHLGHPLWSASGQVSLGRSQAGLVLRCDKAKRQGWQVCAPPPFEGLDPRAGVSTQDLRMREESGATQVMGHPDSVEVCQGWEGATVPSE